MNARKDSQPGENLDLTDESAASFQRPYVGILFECCGVYQRVYRRPEQSTYTGHCPRCLRPVKLRVGPGGTTARIFRAR